MKTIFTISLLVSIIVMQAQNFISEIQFKNNTWYIELINKKNIKIKSLHLQSSTGSADVKQWVIDSLNKPNALLVITDTAVVSHFNFKNSPQLDSMSEYIMAKINDTLVEKLGWECDYPLVDESLVWIDSTEMHSAFIGRTVSNNQYIGRSVPSLGRPNKMFDAIAFVSGKNYSVPGTLRKADTLFMDFIWNMHDGKNYAVADSEGNIFFALWPTEWSRYCTYGREPNIGRLCKDDMGYSKEVKPGMNFLDACFLTRLKTIAQEVQLTINPTVVTSMLHIEYSVQSLGKGVILQICSSQGQMLQSKVLEASESSIQMQIPETISNGTYFCSLISGGVVYKTVQFMVQR